ncbi:Hha/YmoA family nucleoid-associated regulatory protein [Pseudomonas amygdali]|uniref:Hha/YmoA family nucleoid-associated regulatory protein n=1 Tax=Pseudomonas amygdali TaxID=47877 RepID=UPI0035DD4091
MKAPTRPTLIRSWTNSVKSGASPLNKQTYLLRFRRCSKQETLDFMVERLLKKVSAEESLAVLAAADHRNVEIATGRSFDKIPPYLWRQIE